MSKLTIFTLFFCSIIVLIAAEILVGEYIRTPYVADLEANFLHGSILGNSEENAEVSVVAPNTSDDGSYDDNNFGFTQSFTQSFATSTSAPALTQENQSFSQAIAQNQAAANTAPVAQSAENQQSTLQTTNSDSFLNISPELLEKAGFTNTTYKLISFGGKLFDRIDISNLNFLNILRYDFLENDISKVLSFYQIKANDAATAKEVYGLIKAKSGAEIGVIVNETNQFGEASFYDNFIDYPERVFLVVKKGNNVYSLSYQKELHPRVQMLLSLLP